MSKFNRYLQREILALAIDAYPAYIGHKHSKIPASYELLKNAKEDLVYPNIHYLHEHSLINFDKIGYRNNNSNPLAWVKATSHGIDFVQQDGGLSAILNVKTIRFHKDTIVVLEDLIAISNMNDTDKEKAKSILSELPVDAIKTVVQTLTTTALNALLKS